jgi:hypothetical protein
MIVRNITDLDTGSSAYTVTYFVNSFHSRGLAKVNFNKPEPDVGTAESGHVMAIGVEAT